MVPTMPQASLRLKLPRRHRPAADALDELHDASERNPHVTLLLAIGLGFLLGIVASTRR
jgi:hypothetical protein